MSDHRDEREERDTEPPTAPDTVPAPPYSGDPPPDILSRIYHTLTSPNGELVGIRRDMNALANAFRNRQREDAANWDFVKREVSGVRADVRRVEDKLDRTEERVRVLEQKVANLESRLAEFEASKTNE